MKRSIAIFAATLLAVLAVNFACPVAASAQTSAPIYIPFTFTASHHVLPSGFYKVSILEDRFVAIIDSNTGRTELVVMVRPEAGNRVETLGGLVFANTGHRYVLTEVRMTGSSMDEVLTAQPKREPLAAKNATESTFEIAMK